jgi:hypothetical protein
VRPSRLLRRPPLAHDRRQHALARRARDVARESYPPMSTMCNATDNAAVGDPRDSMKTRFALAPAREPDGVVVAVRVFREVPDDGKAVFVQHGAVFLGGEARMIERLAVKTADRLTMRRS